MDPVDEPRRRTSAWGPPAAPPVEPTPSPVPANEASLGERVREFATRMGFADVDVPFDSPAEAARWWFRPLADARTWRSLGAAGLMAVLAPVLFGLTLAVVAVVGALTLVFVGLALVVPGFAGVNAFASCARGVAGWTVDRSIPKRPFENDRSGFIASVSGRLSDGTRWRQVSFLLLDVIAAPVFLAGSLLPIVFVANLFGAVDDVLDFAIDFTTIQVLLAVVLLAPAARVVQFVGELRHRYVSAFLGPDPSAALADRVEELSVQRDQVLDAVASERRRIERNLHDGVQQQIVALGIDIGRARNKIDDDPDAARLLLDDARDKVRSSIGELRLIGRGLHPAVLDDRGLDAALSAVVATSPIPITVDIVPPTDAAGQPGRFPSEIDETAYYIANEAVANVLKYSGARVASIRVEPDTGLLPAVRVTVHDDGRGGADETRGSGIAGMRARVEAVDGAFRIESPVGGPTVATAVIPLRRGRSNDAGTSSDR